MKYFYILLAFAVWPLMADTDKESPKDKKVKNPIVIMKTQVACRNAILGDSNINDTTAWCVERVGDALRHFNLDEAKEAYQETIRTLKVS